MEETGEGLPNFSIGIDLLGPDPISNKNKSQKNSQIARFANLSVDQLQQIWPKDIHWEQKKVTNWSLSTFKGKISVLMVVLKFVQPGE